MTGKISWKKITAAVSAAAALVFLCCFLIGNPVVWYHNYCLKEAVREIGEEKTVSLNETVPFSWDTVYTFEPYTAAEEIEKVIGFHSSSIRETVNEGMVQLLFVKGQKVTASVCGYAKSLGYDIRFKGAVAHKDDAVFQVNRESGIVRLSLKSRAGL